MKHAHLGRTGLTVSRLCLGTMNFGSETPETDALAIMDKALDLGINFFDTANIYGFKVRRGLTEEILGRWLAQGGGLLAGVPNESDRGRRSALSEKYKSLQTQLDAYESLCSRLAETPANVALAWLLHNPVVTGPIIGPRTIEQLTGSVRALEIELDDETLGELDFIWPGPGGEAPQAYAW